MFFRRERPRTITFNQRMEDLRKAGFTVVPLDGRGMEVSRGECAALVEEGPDGKPRLAERAGVRIGGGIGKLVDAGFQKFFQVPGGPRKPALASELKELHCFEDDLREVLGLDTLYNEALGTVSTLYLYDRVKDRDRGVPKRPWE